MAVTNLDTTSKVLSFNCDDMTTRMTRTIKELRQAMGWSQNELSRRATMHPSDISRIESGRLRPSEEELSRIARALNTTPQDLTESGDVWRGFSKGAA
jgi:transcriptional regulator with XRE-family HTH domain